MSTMLTQSVSYVHLAGYLKDDTKTKRKWYWKLENSSNYYIKTQSTIIRSLQ